jgi:hypothetical protein
MINYLLSTNHFSLFTNHSLLHHPKYFCFAQYELKSKGQFLEFTQNSAQSPSLNLAIHHCTLPKTCVTSPKTFCTFPKTCVTFPQTFCTFPQTFCTFPKTCVTVPKTCVTFPQTFCTFPKTCVTLPKTCWKTANCCCQKVKETLNIY